jgi:hypothetical protein
MDTNFKAETPLSEDEARAKYTSTLTLFNAKCNTVEALRVELEEESVELTRLKGEVDRYSAAYLRAVERATLEQKPAMPEAYEEADAVAEAKGKMESRTLGKILGRTEDAPAYIKPHSEETAPPAPEVEVSDAPAMFAPSGTRPEMDVTEGDRDEALLATPTPGQRRAENISDNVTPLTPERQAEAEDILETVDNILSDD